MIDRGVNRKGQGFPVMKQTLNGRLDDWQMMTTRLEELKAHGRLDEAESQMIAVLRHGSNLLLREQVLLNARQVAAPSDGLTAALLDVVCDRKLFIDERILAAQALACLVTRLKVNPRGQLRQSEMIRKLARTLDVPEAQVFRQAVAKVIERIQSREPDNNAEG